ncbi:MAG TPA: efflux RND transporter periplasmic adaptor subunit [Candidatus Acidoferrales bacterium]|nr:efflux RND transporter periplasmic adaptor subunit [Candidatus Acidoferrales bacterium]
MKTQRILLAALWLATLTTLLAVLAGCADEAPPPAPPRVTVSQPLVQKVLEWDEYTGRLEATEQVEVRARVSGYLQSIHFNDGQIVKKGDLLFVIDPRPYQAEVDRVRAELDLARARLELARSDHARARALLQFRAISQEEADTRAATERQAEQSVAAGLAAVKAAMLNLEFTRVTAPITGRIGRRLVTEGNLINGGSAQATLLTTIVSLDPIYAYFEADERSYLRYMRAAQNGKQAGARASRIPVYLALADEKGFPHAGYIDFIDNRLDARTGTMTGRAVFSNPRLALTPGLFARVRLPAASAPREALLVPDEAIGSDQARKFVFVVNGDNTVEYRTVELGPLVHGFRVIRAGLRPEDWLVTSGVQRARPGLRVSPERRAISVPEKIDFLSPVSSASANGHPGAG